MTTSDDVNPYASPSELCGETPRRTRWRIIPVTLFSLYGLLGLVSSPIMLVVAFRRPAEIGGGITPLLALATTLFGISSFLWIGTAAFCWRGKWRWMVLALLLAIGGTMIAQHLLAGLGYD